MNNLLNFLWNGGRTPSRPTPARTTTARPSRPKRRTSPTEADRLMIDKVARQIDLIERSYDRSVWSSAQHRQSWTHDLVLMLAYGDLRAVTFEFMNAQNDVEARFEYMMTADKRVRIFIDSAEGVELPFLEKKHTVKNRVTVSRNGRESLYRDQLVNSWSAAEKLHSRTSSSFKSEHTQKITGGRQAGRVDVSSDARYNLQVYNAGDKGYCFARATDLGIDGVFVHSKFCNGIGPLRPGDRITAVLIQTPRGVQARDVRRTR